MIAELSKHYDGINKTLTLVELLYKLRIINSNRFMAAIIELHNKPHNLILGG